MQAAKAAESAAMRLPHAAGMAGPIPTLRAVSGTPPCRSTSELDGRGRADAAAAAAAAGDEVAPAKAAMQPETVTSPSRAAAAAVNDL